MSQQRNVSEVLVKRIGEAAFVLEQTLGAMIDEAEGGAGDKLGVLESLEVLEATLVYHRRSTGGVTAERAYNGGGASARGNGRLRHGGPFIGDSSGSAPTLVERVIECGTRLHALSLMYGLLQRIAGDEGSVELSARAGLYRRDLLELGDEIERCLFGGTSLTGVINASRIVG